MKTLLIILSKLIVSQLVLTELGPRNPLTHFSSVSARNIRSFLHQALNVME